MSNHTIIPLDGGSVIAAPSSSNTTYSDPASILNNRTWLLAENEPGYWTASFDFTFTPDRMRLWNADVDGSGTKTFFMTPQSTVSIANLSYADPSTSEMTTCDRACPLPEGSSPGYQDFFFINVISMNAFRLDITDWYGSEGGLKGIQLIGTSQATSARSTSSSAASSTSTLISTSPASASSSPTGAGSPQASSNKISGGAIAGIVIGVIAGILIAVAFFILWRRNSRRRVMSDEKFVPLGGRHEVDADDISRTKYREELGGHAVSELDIVSDRQELEGSAVPELPSGRRPG